MTTHTVTTSSGDVAALEQAAVDQLRADLGGAMLLPGDADYEEARQIWNAMIDRRPALIARCQDTADVACVVNFAREHSLLLAIRGGGHHIAGNAICDGGVVIDLSQMRGVEVDVATQRANVEGGATLADVDAATQAHGLAVPLGINSTTGVAGLTLGGGFGWLSRKYGMTVDNLESAEVVLADGRVLQVSATEHADLFWAIRGGGGNFGVVTRFTFQLHAVGPEVLSGLIVFPIAEAKAVLQRYRAFMETAPDDVTVWTIAREAPPLPFLPEAVHGTKVLVLALCYAGAPAEGEPLIAPLRTFGTVLGEHVGVQPYSAWQQAFDPLLTPGARNYWKSHNFTALADGLLDTVVEYIDTLPSSQCEIFFGAVGGATGRVAADATAYAHRGRAVCHERPTAAGTTRPMTNDASAGRGSTLRLHGPTQARARTSTSSPPTRRIASAPPTARTTIGWPWPNGSTTRQICSG